MKKVLSFFGLCFAAMGAIGGVFMAIHFKTWYLVVGVCVLAYCAFPKVKELYANLWE